MNEVTLQRKELALETEAEITLSLLAEDPDSTVRMAVAVNSHSTPRVLEKLAKDPDPLVRREVARNLCTTPNALVSLAQDSFEDVLVLVAGHPRVPVSILSKLSDSESFYVRLAVRANANQQSQPESELMDEESESAVTM